jgi:hypothetical protein
MYNINNTLNIFIRKIDIYIYIYIILPVVLYGCRTWYLTLREKRRRKVFEIRVLKSISGLKRDKIIGRRRKLHNKELHNLYFSPNIIGLIKSRRMRWTGHLVRIGRGKIRTGF